MNLRITGAVIALCCWIPMSHADWRLDSSMSRVNFVTTKATHIAEVNGFDGLEGSIGGGGKATVTIDLASVNTAIDIRNERIREHLFEVAKYPKAVVTAQVDIKAIESMVVGGSANMDLKGNLNLHGVTMAINTPVTVVKQSADKVLVFSSSPLVVNASAVDLADGVEKLREIAGLPNISLSVPVTFQLVFAKTM